MREVYFYFDPIDWPTDCIFGCLPSADRLPDPVLFPSLTTIYEASNAQRGVPSVTPKIIIDYYPLAFGGTQEMNSSSRMDRREAWESLPNGRP